MPLTNEKILKKFADTAKQDMLNFDPFNTQFTFWKGTLTLGCQDQEKDHQQPLDTFLDFTGFTKGIVFVNGFHLGRYWPRLGPQKTLYLPGPLLKGKCQENTVLILEQDSADCLQESWAGGCAIHSGKEHKIDDVVPKGM